MSFQSDLKSFIKDNLSSADIAFHEEINTVENKDYRRGFRAGVLFAFLKMNSEF